MARHVSAPWRMEDAGMFPYRVVLAYLPFCCPVCSQYAPLWLSLEKHADCWSQSILYAYFIGRERRRGVGNFYYVHLTGFDEWLLTDHLMTYPVSFYKASQTRYVHV